MTTPVARAVGEGVARALADLALPGLVSAYLFGSHVTGRARRQSDVDVGVLLAWGAYGDPRTRFDVRVRLAAHLARAVDGRAVDVVILNDVPPTLGRHVVLEGRRLACGDPAADHAYRRDVQLRAADLAPFLRRTRAVKLAALAR